MQGITQILDNFTLIRGRHSFKQGFDFQMRARHARACRSRRSTPSRPWRRTWRPRRVRRPNGYTTFAQVLGDPELRDEQQAVQRVLAGRLARRREPEGAVRRPLRRLLLSDRRIRPRRSRIRRSSRTTPTTSGRGSASRGRSAPRRIRSCAPAPASCTTSRCSPSTRTRSSRTVCRRATTFSVNGSGHRRAGLPEYAVEPARRGGAAGAVDLRARPGPEAGLQHPEQRAVRARLRQSRSTARLAWSTTAATTCRSSPTST